ncbi:MAG: TIGR03619 family F420-dependent LLM class oxidoreductase [Deltaproteobacteria bacterium]|nr:TIGR03619 family F420-dependent LLM class oxidoreductase [Deltaproteobacteria bacterium]MBW2382412.1 TIGR03619 family F420-dependent LLM class oxidoreductase [Deltaproteobacteria bacterium]MBW2699022.1 TIGR03619 family F420-dependent LLM class oxidoreductase [Deltaproteobacteria bacterium]
MRFSYAESMCDPSQYMPLVMAAEEAGYASFCVPDSICYPEVSDSKYPYTPDGNREFLDGKPFIEPFVLIPALAAVTERIRFTTFVVKLAIRQPVLVAKQVMSIAVMSNNRFGFGVGLSPWPEDFRVAGAEWKARGKRMDEMIEIIRGLARGEFFEFHGDHYDIESIRMSPAPTQPIPILVGGHADRALRRAARIGDGWMHAGGDPETLLQLLGRVKELRKEYGRENDPFEIHVISMDGFTLDGVKRLEDLGVTDTIVGFRNAYEADTTTLDQKLGALRAFADSVIAKL